MLLLSDKLNGKQKRWVFKMIIIVVMINIVDNIRLCILHPELNTIVNRGMLASKALDGRINIGGSKFYNAIYFFFTVCFFCFLNSRQKVIRHLLMASVVLSLVFISVFCLKAAVILFSCLSVILLYFAKKSRSAKKFFVRIAMPAFFALLVVLLFEDVLIELILNTFTSDRLAQRLILLIDSDSEYASAGASTVNARADLWMMSINTWLDNPVNFIFGIGDHRANWGAGETAAETGIGQHSDFLDSLARYGLIGALLLIAILKLSFTYIKSLFDIKYHLQLLIIFLLFILFGLSKGVFTLEIGCALFIILPLFASFVDLKEE
jgi:hypothetical protein